jgi:hypothetical protein
MPARMLAGAMCVQRFDGSLNSAIHITYRISLRSSSMPEPRDPLLKVLIHLFALLRRAGCGKERFRGLAAAGGGPPRSSAGGPAARGNENKLGYGSQGLGVVELGNDPSAGSPTETLLRLLLPLNDRVWITFRPGRVVAHPSGPVRKPH